jgi:hypothetical protein
VYAFGIAAAAITLPFAIWDWGVFVEDTLLFPLHLGRGSVPGGRRRRSAPCC